MRQRLCVRATPKDKNITDYDPVKDQVVPHSIAAQPAAKIVTGSAQSWIGGQNLEPLGD
jgi:hypothetical protein